MNRIIRAIAVLALGLWVGWVAGMFATAGSLFANDSGQVPNTTVAADILGPLFHKMYVAGWMAFFVAYTALGAALFRKAISLRAFIVADALITLAFAATFIAEVPVTNRLKEIRTELKKEFGGYHLAPKDHPARKEFGKLHGVSMLATLVGLLSATGAMLITLEINPRRVEPTDRLE